MNAASSKETTTEGQQAVVFFVMDGVHLHIQHEAIPAFLLMRSTQQKALTSAALQAADPSTADGLEWVLNELSDQLHDLIPHAICRKFDVSGGV